MSIDDMTKTPEETIAKARADNLVCIFPEDYELLLDIDIRFKFFAINKEMQNVLTGNGVNILSELITESKSGNTHVYYWIDEKVTQAEAIALQACLGSDLKREMLSLLRLRSCGTPVALFETPDQAELVRKWREVRG